MRPELHIDRITLRPIGSADTGFAHRLLTGSQVRRFLCDDRVITEAELLDMLNVYAQFEAEGFGLWVIEADTGSAGLIGLAPISGPLLDIPKMAGGVEPIIALDPEHWGQGLAHRAMSAIIDYARDACSLSRLVAAVDAPNESSHRLLKGCGFNETGRAPGLSNDLVHYELWLDPGNGG